MSTNLFERCEQAVARSASEEHACFCANGKCAERLERDPMSTRDRVDWSAKKFLLDALQQEETFLERSVVQAIDLEYHNLDLDRGFTTNWCAKV